MLRALTPVRALSESDRDEALLLCARNPAANVFVAARIHEGMLRSYPGALLGYRAEGALTSLCWSAANLVPVGADTDALDQYAIRVRRWRHRCASIFGPSELVVPLWDRLRVPWGAPRALRTRQPLMLTSTRPSQLGVELHPHVRPATESEVDRVLPAAAAMFTAEIGYPPYRGSAQSYRSMLLELIRRGHTFVWVDGGEVVFKADVGSTALGVAQIQGVWLTPRLRGQGFGAALMGAVTEQVIATIAPQVSLYVNDFNAPAIAVYKRVGFTEAGTFSTVLL